MKKQKPEIISGISVEVNGVQEAIGYIKKIINPSTVSVWTEGSSLKIGASSEGAALILSMPVLKLASDVKFSVPLDVLYGALKGRKTMDIVTEDNAVKCTSSRYTSTLSVSEFLVIKTEGKGDPVIISGEHQEALTAALSLSIDPVWDNNPVTAAIRIGKSNMEIVFYDSHHIAYRKLPISSNKPFDFSLPVDTFARISSVAGRAKYKMSISESSIRAGNSSFDLVLPLTHGSVNPPENAYALLKTLDSKQSKCHATVQRKFLDLALENTATFHEPRAYLSLVTKPNALSLQIKSSVGSAQASVPYSKNRKRLGEIKCRIDINLLKDILKGRQTDVEIHLKDDKLLWINCPQENGVDRFCAALSS